MNCHLSRKPARLVFIALTVGLGACASQQRIQDDPDPLEPANRQLFNLNEAVDAAILKPAAQGYVKITPQPVRAGVTNFFENATYMNVIMNSFLQAEFGSGFSDLGRLVVNSTLGVAGLFDVATGMGMPVREKDTGQTLGKWGFGAGAYLFLPGRGSYTIRDISNLATNTLLFPFTYTRSAVLIPVIVLMVLNARANSLTASALRDVAALDSYTFTREAYFEKRRALIRDGDEEALREFDETFSDDVWMDECEQDDGC
ncbi:MAG: VacJ family lipoprotein [Pseudohongiellaceae bacterium]